MQGLHSTNGSFDILSMSGSLTSHNVAMSGVSSSIVQQPGGSISSGRFASNNLPVAISQISHGNSHGHSGITSRGDSGIVGTPAFSSSLNGVGGSLPGISSNSVLPSNRSSVPSMSASPILGNVAPRIANSMGNIVSVGNIGRSISTSKYRDGGSLPGIYRDGGSLPGISSNSVLPSSRNSVPSMNASPILGNVAPRIANSMGNIVSVENIGRSISTVGVPFPVLPSRVNIATNSGSGGSLNLQGTNRLLGSMLQQVPQMIGMLGNSYTTSGGLLSQNQIQSGNSELGSAGILNNFYSNDSSAFDMNDFPQLSGRPSSSGGQLGQMGSLRKQGINSIVQKNQEFSIQIEDFPALPGIKGGTSDFAMDLRQEQLNENGSVMQSQHFLMGRSAGFNPSGHHQQQQRANSISTAGVTFTPGSIQELLHLYGSDLFSSSHGSYRTQVQANGLPGMGLSPLSAAIPASSEELYDQNFQQYQHPQNHSPQRVLEMSPVTSYKDQSLKSLQGSQTPSDRFDLLGLLSVIRMSNPDLTSLSLGIDLTTLGLNLNSTDNLHKKFGSPWSDEPFKGEPDYCVPSCYYAKEYRSLQQRHFSKFQLGTLFYIFYSMPKDEAQIYAAHELYSRGWFYHKEAQLWFTRIPNMEPLVKTHTYERAAYFCFDPNTWEMIQKENVVVHYNAVEMKPNLLPQI